MYIYWVHRLYLLWLIEVVVSLFNQTIALFKSVRGHPSKTSNQKLTYGPHLPSYVQIVSRVQTSETQNILRFGHLRAIRMSVDEGWRGFRNAKYFAFGPLYFAFVDVLFIPEKSSMTVTVSEGNVDKLLKYRQTIYTHSQYYTHRQLKIN